VIHAAALTAGNSVVTVINSAAQIYYSKSTDEAVDSNVIVTVNYKTLT
jgi:predicted short-subunit dehydrogenase-like oxidoreductase (DUF2520 family)